MTDRSITLVRRYAQAPAAVFRAWTDPELLRRWYAPVDGWIVGSAEVTPGVGGSYAVSFGPPPGGDAYSESGVYTVFEPPHRLEWTGSVGDGESPADVSRITVAIAAVDGGSEVTVTESGFTDDDVAAEHEEGWTAVLAHLASTLGG